MPLTFEGFSTTVVVTPPFTITPSVPPGTLAGDLSFVQLSGDVAAPIAPFPAGWTELAPPPEPAVVHKLWFKVLAFPGETGTWTFAGGIGTIVGQNSIFRGIAGAIPSAYAADLTPVPLVTWPYASVLLPMTFTGILLFTAQGIVMDSLVNFLPAPTVSRYTSQIIVAGGTITMQLNTVGTLLTFGQQGPGLNGPWTADTLSGLPRSGSTRTVAITSIESSIPGGRGFMKRRGGGGIRLPIPSGG